VLAPARDLLNLVYVVDTAWIEVGVVDQRGKAGRKGDPAMARRRRDGGIGEHDGDTIATIEGCVK